MFSGFFEHLTPPDNTSSRDGLSAICQSRSGLRRSRNPPPDSIYGPKSQMRATIKTEEFCQSRRSQTYNADKSHLKRPK
jgi:hypothetical protein